MLLRKYDWDDPLEHFFTEEKNMKCDIYEQDNTYHIEMDLPGFSKEEIKIECSNGNLIVTATKENQMEEKDETKHYLRKERNYGKYSRSFYLKDSNEEAISATYKEGTLHIEIPITKEENNRKFIDIN